MNATELIKMIQQFKTINRVVLGDTEMTVTRAISALHKTKLSEVLNCMPDESDPTCLLVWFKK